MADPVIAVILYAVSRGILSLADYTTSDRWQAGAHLRLRAAKREMDARVHQVRATAIGGRESAVQDFEQAVKPWLHSQARPADDLDLVAGWYIMYRPERLKKLGVNFGTLEPVSGRRPGGAGS